MAAFAVLSSAAFPAHAPAVQSDFALDSVGVSLSTAQAGGHPDFETRFQLSGNPIFDEEGQDLPWAKLRDLAIELPAGLVGNLNRFPTCSAAVFVGQLGMLEDAGVPACPAESQVGILSPGLTGIVAFPPGLFRTPLYNLERPDGQQQVVARLGAIAVSYPVFVDIRLDPKRGNALTASLVNAPSVAGMSGANTTLWGVPAHPSHDDERFNWLEANACNGPCSGPRPATSVPIALMANSTSCGAGDIGMEAISYADDTGGDFGFAPISIGGCDVVPFAPSLTVAPTTRRAGSSSGVDVDVTLPQPGLSSPNGLRTADIRRAVVRLPKALSLNASVADGIAGCTEAGVGFDPDERQLVGVAASGAPTILVFDGHAAPPLPELASAQEVESGLVALPDLRDGDISVTGRPGGPWQVDFDGSQAGRDVSPIDGIHGELQRLVIKATGGTYALAFEGEVTAPIPFDADAATVKAALEALHGIGPGDVVVSGGPMKGGAVFHVAFGGGLGWTDAAQITTMSSLVGAGSFAKSYVLTEGGSAVATRTIEQGGSLRFDGADALCPEASKIAEGEITTPLLPDPLQASVYLASPRDNPFDSLYGAYLVADGDGTRLKVAGRLRIEPETERIVVTFEDIPQVPISDLQLQFKGGNRGIVTAPSECGTYRTDWELTPWSDDTPASGISEFTIDEDCTPEERPLVFRAGSETANAGAFTSFAARVSRPRRSASLRRIAMTTPPGITARLAGVARCPQSIVDALTGPPTDAVLERRGDVCPAASRIGNVTVGSGSGSPFFVESGSLFLAGPYNDAPLSMVAVVPAIGGPFDLGSLVVRIAIYVDPETAQVRAVSDPLPTTLEGIPLELRDVRVNLDRIGFAINPTSCGEDSVVATLERANRIGTGLFQRFQVGSCADLGFEPRVQLLLSGGISRSGHPKIAVRVVPRAGDANIESATIALPAGELLDVRRLRTLCARHAQRCPSSSVVGHAVLRTPLLESSLKGPIYLRAPIRGLPDLIAELHGGDFHLVVHGRTDGRSGRLRVRFPAVPDVPLSSAILTLDGGRRGMIVNSESLCARPHFATVALTAHSGRRLQVHPALRVRGRC